MFVVKPHCGSAHVKGRARNYTYYVGSLFKPVRTKGGRVVFRNAKLICGPYRSINKVRRELEQYADKFPTFVRFVEDYGSLHNKEYLIHE